MSLNDPENMIKNDDLDLNVDAVITRLAACPK